MTRDMILLLEDDPSLATGVRDILDLHDYDVSLANNGREGLEVLNKMGKPPQLIISDISMPEMDGYAFLEEIRRHNRWRNIPFIFLSAKGERQDVRLGTMLGAEHYITKPFETDDLLVAVAARIKRSKQIEEDHDKGQEDLKKRVLTIIHHEFRTPMTYMVAYADLMRTDPESLGKDELREFLSGVNAGAERLRRLVDSFILLAELETGEVVNTFQWRKRHFSEYDALLSDAVNLAQANTDYYKATITILPLPPNLPPVIADYEYLKGALVRLLDNAVKFGRKEKIDGHLIKSKTGHHVYVSVFSANHPESDQPYVYFQIRDEGRGIRDDEQAKIFASFYQTDRRLHEDQGAGVGLAIVEKIVALHNGQITLESQENSGSVFTIGIPATFSTDY
jgi:two-component system, sensor histidine kinase and response regulator